MQRTEESDRRDEQWTPTSPAFSPVTIKHVWHTRLSVSQRERCTLLCVLAHRHPVCLTLPELFGPPGPEQPDLERERDIKKRQSLTGALREGEA